MLDVFILRGRAGNRKALSATLLSILSFAAMLAGPTEAASVDGLVAPLARDAGGDAEGPQPESGDRRPVAEDRRRPPPPVNHPLIFRDATGRQDRTGPVHEPRRGQRASLGSLQQIQGGQQIA